MKQNSFFQYLEFEKRFSPHTIQAYKGDIEQFFLFLENTCGITNIIEAKHTHIRSWIVNQIQNGLTTRSVNRKLSALKTYFKFLRRANHIDKNPMLKLIAPKVGKRLPVFVNEQNMLELFDGVDFGKDYAAARNKMIMELLYNTGMRRSELITLQIKDIDFTKQYLKVLGKGNKERLIPFGQHLATALKKYLNQRDEFFPNTNNQSLFLTDKGKILYPKLVYNLVKKYLSLVTTVEQRSPHVLRHTFATHLSDNGADLNAIKELLGHSNLAATQIYTHNSIEKLKKVYKNAHPKSGKQN